MLYLVTTAYTKKEQDELVKAGYLAKLVGQLHLEKDLIFNSGNILINYKEHIYLTQQRQCNKI
jgi:hypothetical protein